MMALELKSKEFCYYVRVIDGAREVVEADMTKADQFLESKPRDANVACARCRSTMVYHMCRSYIICIDWYAGCLRDAEVMKNTAEI